MRREQSEALAADWRRLGLTAVYPFPEDLLRESQRLHARQRTIGFNCVRSNPKLCGYNLTGILDHGMTGDVTLWGVDSRVEEWLTACGLHCRLLTADSQHALGGSRLAERTPSHYDAAAVLIAPRARWWSFRNERVRDDEVQMKQLHPPRGVVRCAPVVRFRFSLLVSSVAATAPVQAFLTAGGSTSRAGGGC